MTKTKYKLGQLTEEYTEINANGELNKISDLQGINNEKYFQESNSNKDDIDLLRYKICRNNTFAYNKATSRNGEKISIAYRTNGDCLVSPSYICFRVKRPDLLLDEYLMLWFRRAEFDKYVRFHSWGSATEFFTYEDFSDTQIELPSIKEQNQIVFYYNVLQTRIDSINKENAHLENLVYKYYVNNTLPNCNKVGKLKDYIKVKRGGSPRPIEKYLTKNPDGYNWLKIADATSDKSPFVLDIKEKIKKDGITKTVFLEKGNFVLSNSATPGLPKILQIDTCIHDGWLYFPNKEYPPEFLYMFFKHKRKELVSNANGSIFLNLKIDIVSEFDFYPPSTDALNDFQAIAEPLFSFILNNCKVVRQLNKLQNSLI